MRHKNPLLLLLLLLSAVAVVVVLYDEKACSFKRYYVTLHVRSLLWCWNPRCRGRVSSAKMRTATGERLHSSLFRLCPRQEPAGRDGEHERGEKKVHRALLENGELAAEPGRREHLHSRPATSAQLLGPTGDWLTGGLLDWWVDTLVDWWTMDC